MPFAAGSRNYPRQPLAHVILRIVLAKIMKKITVSDRLVYALQKLPYGNGERDEEGLQQIMRLRKDMQAGFTVLPFGGVNLYLHKRPTHEEYRKKL